MTKNNINAPYIIVLGTIQDGGFTSPKSQKKYYNDSFKILKNSKKVSSIAIVDPINKQQWIIDASPDFKEQLYNLQEQTSLYDLDGILLTHAHIGHYLGLAYLGKEAMNTEKVKVFCMKRMINFLNNNGPWDQLIKNNNIYLSKIKKNKEFELNKNIKVIPFTVPHRDEYSETVCFLIISKQKKLIYIPDIDKWNLWGKNILEIIKSVDYALIDGTFYDENELERDMSKIPHPFVCESMELFKNLSNKEKNKIFFTHLNHTNPLLIKNSIQQKEVIDKGFNIAQEKMILKL
ncbi:MAG: MBL fold metallo-hydrolase [Flavobacteriales bacterium]